MRTQLRASRLLTLAFAWAAMAGAARAEPAPGTGVEIGIRLGYALALGQLAKDDDLHDLAAGNLPIWLDVGYRILPQLFVGAYAQYGIGFTGASADVTCGQSNYDCTLTDLRLGLEAQYHPLPQRLIDPWFGVGAGYEWLTLAVERGAAADASSTPGSTASVTYHGFELARFDVGVGWKLAKNFYLGPSLALSLGRYTEASANCSGPPLKLVSCSARNPVADAALHEWLTFAVRGVYAP